MAWIVSAHDDLGLYGPFDDENEADEFAFAHNGRVVELRPPVFVSTYTCQHCGAASPKGQWGPGHVRCPRCGKVALSAAEAGWPSGLPAVPREHCGRCDHCGWELGRSANVFVGDLRVNHASCRPGDCSMRPLPRKRETCAGCGAPFEVGVPRKLYQYYLRGQWETIQDGGNVEIVENDDGSLSCRNEGGRSTFEEGVWRVVPEQP